MSEAAITVGNGIPVGNVIVDPGAIKGVGSWHNPYLCIPIKMQMYGRKEREHVALIRLTATLHLKETIDINNQFGDRVVYDLLFNMAHRSTVATKPAEGDVQLLFSLTHEQIKRLEIYAAHQAATSSFLSSKEWQTRPQLINSRRGYAPAAFLLLAEIHGRIGHFPTLIRMRPQHSSVTTYEVIELLNLQTIRDAARKSSDASITPEKRAMKSLL